MWDSVPSRTRVADLAADGLELSAATGRALERDEETIRQWKQQRRLALKKGQKRRPDDRLPRRKRIERTPASLPYLVTTWADASAARSLQLANPAASAAPPSWQLADHLGWPARPPQPWGRGFRAPAERTSWVGVSARLRSGIESGGVPLVALEAARVAQLLSAELRPAQRARSPCLTANAPPTHAGLCLLGAGGVVPLGVVKVGVNKAL